jgi:hypothetical protein
MTPRPIQVPNDPLLDPLVRRLGIWRFALVGLAWSVAVDIGAALVLRGFGVDAHYLYDDPTLRGLARAYQILIDIGGPTTIWALYAWLRIASGSLMDDLGRRNVFMDEPVDAEQRPREVEALGWMRRYAWLIGLGVAGTGAFQHLVDPPGWNAASALHAQLRLAASIPLWYVMWMSVAAASVTAAALAAAFERYPIRIHIFHPDDHGGFGPLRRFIGTLVTYLLAISALLAAAVALATITSQISGDRLDQILVAYVVGFLAIAPTILVAIIWPAHNAMLRARARFADSAGPLVAETALSGKALTSADLERMQKAQRISEIVQAFPVWPFNPGRLRRAIVGILSPLFIGVLLDFVLRRLR